LSSQPKRREDKHWQPFLIGFVHMFRQKRKNFGDTVMLILYAGATIFGWLTIQMIITAIYLDYKNRRIF